MTVNVGHSSFGGVAARKPSKRAKAPRRKAPRASRARASHAVKRSGNKPRNTAHRTVHIPSSGTLTPAQVSALNRSVGLPPIFDHIVYAESTRGAGKDNGIARGLYQINYHANADLVKKFGDPANPVVGAKIAKYLYDHGGLTPWNASRNAGAGGGWGQYLNASNSKAPSPSGNIGVTVGNASQGPVPFNQISQLPPQVQDFLKSKGVDPSISIPNPLKPLDAFFSGITDPNLWLRVGKVILGGIILLIGVWWLIRAGMGDKKPIANPTKLLKKVPIK